ncbi:protease modulator HflC [Sphingosinicella sp. GR2756]|uniref:Protein HflC n=1 Tax=Sphingosinicella rhizophila TaxID=3050082 RepID=A0ABU3Q6N8_9SPHN|nr:protease modulator HflC [Sphingosinicella sp. GR2756]MDT9599071.1 protease modulator HflC [Sphingosinicella sp. GR2756]
MGQVVRNPIAMAFAAIFVLIVAGTTFAVVPETQQAVIVRFGEPNRIINRYREGAPFGETGAGLIVRIPFMEEVHWIDKRILSVDMDRQQVLSTDQLRLQVDAFARYRIVDPLRMYISARTEERVSDQLRPILGSALRNELGRRPFAALLSPERGQMMDNIQNALNRVAKQYGAEIVDVRIKRADLPEGTPLQSAYQRMQTARQQEARSIRAQGSKQAQIIRADADAEAANTYAEAFGKDPDFYDFYRAMQSYEATFVNNGSGEEQGRSSIILSPDNDYLREFRGRR